MNIKLKLLLFSILISVSNLSFAVDTDGDGIDDSADICPAFNGNGASTGETEADPDILRFDWLVPHAGA